MKKMQENITDDQSTPGTSFSQSHNKVKKNERH